MIKSLFLQIIILFALQYSLPVWAQLNLLTSEQQRYPIENVQINESSGLACSTREKKILWTHNDSGHMQIIYALDTRGKALGTFHLDDLDSYDWEDMDAFKYHDEHYLLIADTGDNFRLRWNYRIIIIKEPVLKPLKNSRERSSTISPAWSFFFKFKNNESYDIESVAVDIVREKILLLSKRTPSAYLFELPLIPSDGKMPTAVKIAELKDIIKPSALDISADGTLMSINTYSRIHRFHRANPEDRWHYQHSLKYQRLFQPEAMCLSKDEKHYFVTSEKKSDLLKLKAR